MDEKVFLVISSPTDEELVAAKYFVLVVRPTLIGGAQSIFAIDNYSISSPTGLGGKGALFTGTLGNKIQTIFPIDFPFFIVAKDKATLLTMEEFKTQYMEPAKETIPVLPLALGISGTTLSPRTEPRVNTGQYL